MSVPGLVGASRRGWRPARLRRSRGRSKGADRSRSVSGSHGAGPRPGCQTWIANPSRPMMRGRPFPCMPCIPPCGCRPAIADTRPELHRMALDDASRPPGRRPGSHRSASPGVGVSTLTRFLPGLTCPGLAWPCHGSIRTQDTEGPGHGSGACRLASRCCCRSMPRCIRRIVADACFTSPPCADTEFPQRGDGMQRCRGRRSDHRPLRGGRIATVHPQRRRTAPPPSPGSHGFHVRDPRSHPPHHHHHRG
jgi:hypothetical protein